MMASKMAWAPIVAFMVSSPLTSPEGLFYSAGLFGWPFAWAFYMASIILGLAGGGIAALLETRGWLARQTRYIEPVPAASKSQVLSGQVYSLDIPAVNPGQHGLVIRLPPTGRQVARVAIAKLLTHSRLPEITNRLVIKSKQVRRRFF